jgi:hypothetical protein
MDQAKALLMALRATAGLGDGTIEPARVEALAGPLGIGKEELPALAARLQEAKQVKMAWGGVLEVLPEPPAAGGGGTTFYLQNSNFQGADFSHAAAFAGRDATTGGTVGITPEEAFGALAAVFVKLQAIRPGLQGEAAEAADKATRSLAAPPVAEAPAEARRAWAGNATAWLGRLLTAAPQAKAAVELGERALKGLGWD